MRRQWESFWEGLSSKLRHATSVMCENCIIAFRFVFSSPKTNLSRRALLQGRLWKFIPSVPFPPLVMRYPVKQVVSGEEKSSESQPRSISGINIDPVPATKLGIRSVSRSLPVFRPPGAIEEFQFLSECTRCGDCIAACPYDAILKAPVRLGNLAGTPIVEADTAACMMCSDFPCIDSCKPGVLTKLHPPIMGTAKITEQLCLTHHHTTCTVCSERCPIDGALSVTDGKPFINEDRCTGCGMCRYVCPAPENAILLMPAFARPGKPST